MVGAGKWKIEFKGLSQNDSQLSQMSSRLVRQKKEKSQSNRSTTINEKIKLMLLLWNMDFINGKWLIITRITMTKINKKINQRFCNVLKKTRKKMACACVLS